MSDVLVVQWSRLGDILHTRPLLRALRRRYGRVVLSCDARYESLAQSFPEVSGALAVDLANMTMLARHVTNHAPLLASLTGELNLTRATYAQAIVLSREPAAIRYAGLLAERIRGFDTAGGDIVDPAEFVWLNSLLTSSNPAPVHIADLWVRMAGLHPQKMWLPILDNSGAARTTERNAIGIICDAGDPSRAIPTFWLKQLVERLTVSVDQRIVLLGLTRTDGLTDISTGPSRIVDTIGKLSLNQLKQALSGLALVIGPDTGSLHLAAALGVPTIGLYTSGAHPQQTGPYAPNSICFYNPVFESQLLNVVASLSRDVALSGPGSLHKALPKSIATPSLAEYIYLPLLDAYGVAFKPVDESEDCESCSKAIRQQFFENGALAAAEPSDGSGVNRVSLDLTVIIPECGVHHYTDDLLIDLAREYETCKFAVFLISSGPASRIRHLPNYACFVELISDDNLQTFAEACNVGARQSRSGWLLFLNNDTRIPPGFLSELYSRRDENTLLSPLIRYPDGLIQNHGVRVGEFEIQEVSHGEEESIESANDALSAVALLLPRTCFVRMGGFDERYRNGYEDLDFCLRAKEAGYESSVIRNVEITHYRASTPNRCEMESESSRRFRERWLSASASVAARRRNSHYPTTSTAPSILLVSDAPAVSAGPMLRWILPIEELGLVRERDYVWIQADETFNEMLSQERLAGVQIVIVFRPLQSERATRLLVDHCLNKKLAAIVDCDDLIFGRVPEGNTRAHAWEILECNYRRILACAGLALVSSPSLIESLAENGYEATTYESNPKIVLQNLMADSGSRDELRIGFVGSPAHSMDLGCILPAIEIALEKLPHAKFYWWGGRPGELSYHPQVRCGGPWTDDYLRHLRRLQRMQLDVAVVPLLDTPVNRSRTPLKCFDNWQLGVPGVYSNIGPYAQVVAHERTGLRIDNTVGDWVDAICRLANEPSLRRHIRGEAFSEFQRRSGGSLPMSVISQIRHARARKTSLQTVQAHEGILS